LNALVFDRGVKHWNGPYAKDVPIDPWWRPYVYTVSENQFQVLSYGADGKPGGKRFDADLSNRVNVIARIDAQWNCIRYVFGIFGGLLLLACCYRRWLLDVEQMAATI